jgi:hypothetical protein
MEQVIYPISYMMLTAESLGVSSCIIGAMGNEITGIQQETYEKVKEQLNLKEGQILSTIITLGYDANPTETIKQRKEFNDVNSILKEDSELDEPLNYLTQVFEMDYDISTGDTKNGTVTYESKEDKDGKKYIELKITPEKGYAVDKIKVKDYEIILIEEA